jgi:hypothetical protein
MVEASKSQISINNKPYRNSKNINFSEALPERIRTIM